MEKQTINLIQNPNELFERDYIKMNPRKLSIISQGCLYNSDSQKLENLSFDLQKKYGMIEFYIKVLKNKLILIPFE